MKICILKKRDTYNFVKDKKKSIFCDLDVTTFCNWNALICHTRYHTGVTNICRLFLPSFLVLIHLTKIKISCVNLIQNFQRKILAMLEEGCKSEYKIFPSLSYKQKHSRKRKSKFVNKVEVEPLLFWFCLCFLCGNKVECRFVPSLESVLHCFGSGASSWCLCL